MFLILAVTFYYMCKTVMTLGLGWVTFWQSMIIGILLCLSPVYGSQIKRGSLYLMIAVIVLQWIDVIK